MAAAAGWRPRTAEVPAGALIAGDPARVVREGVTWQEQDSVAAAAPGSGR